jgi:predicted phosphodiesterase
MKKGIKPQDCDRITHWPFPLLAKNAAAFKPDLVIHVGDYLYRESLGYPHGDNWLTWNIDFFKPVKPLLQSAPLIFVRGNHENCDRAGEGWTKLLDPFGFKHCFNHSPIYNVSIGGKTTLAIMDSANASDFVAPANEVTIFENYLQSIEKNTDQHTWLITHKPFWFVFDDDELTQTYQNHIMNTLETAWENTSPQNIGVIISGHVHRLQTLNFAKDRPPQIVVGAGGTSLDGSLDRTALKGLTAANEPITEGISLIEFGYMTMERKGDSWTAQMRNIHGRILENCTLQDKKFSCTATTLESRLEAKQSVNRSH